MKSLSTRILIASATAVAALALPAAASATTWNRVGSTPHDPILFTP